MANYYEMKALGYANLADAAAWLVLEKSYNVIGKTYMGHRVCVFVHILKNLGSQQCMMRTIQGTPYMTACMHPMVTAWAGELSVMFDASREGLWSKGEAGPCVSFQNYFNDI